MDVLTVIVSGLLAVIINVIGSFWLKERLSQSIKYEYDQDLERVKKDLEFELDKKKRLYEGKLSQYKKYFSLMDRFSEETRVGLFEILNDGVMDIINDPEGGDMSKYISVIMEFQNKAYGDFLKFKYEINGLRLESGEKLLEYLDEYIDMLEIIQEKTSSFLSSFNSYLQQIFEQSIDVNSLIEEHYNKEFKGLKESLDAVQNKIFIEMRVELGIV